MGNSMKKALLSVALVLFCGAILFAGGGAEGGAKGGKAKVTVRGTDGTVSYKEFGYTAKPAREYTIALVVKGLDPVWEAHLIAGRKAAKDLGVKVLDYAPSQQDNIAEQKRILEDCLATGVDAVVLAPANGEAVRGPVLDLIKAGIPVVYDNTMGPKDIDYLTFVGINDVEVGRIVAEKMSQLLGGQGNLLILEGTPGQSTSDARTKGAEDYLKANSPNIVYEKVVTNWQYNNGLTVTGDYISKWGDKLKAIVAFGGTQAEGAVEAVKASPLKGKVLISSFNVLEPQYKAIEAGDEVFTVSQGNFDQAYLSIVAAVRALNGESVPREIQVPITVVTKENFKEMDERPDALRSR
jgi:ABC-type sugar transport system substrate-binding protein